MKMGVFLRVNSRESIRSNRPDSRCESPVLLSFEGFFLLKEGAWTGLSFWSEISGSQGVGVDPVTVNHMGAF